MPKAEALNADLDANYEKSYKAKNEELNKNKKTDRSAASVNSYGSIRKVLKGKQ